MESYPVLVGIHNALRWIVLVAAVAAIVGAWQGFLSKRDWTKGDRLRTVAYVASMHLQFLLGLILYVQSPVVQAAFDDPGWAMGESMYRFYFVEHITLMILAVIVVQLGSILAKKAEEDRSKHKRAGICYTIGLILILAGIPWQYSTLIPTF